MYLGFSFPWPATSFSHQDSQQKCEDMPNSPRIALLATPWTGRQFITHKDKQPSALTLIYSQITKQLPSLLAR